jgi:uncharacterized metal-binding protein
MSEEIVMGDRRNKNVSKIPEIGILACFSGASNSGLLTGLAALNILKELGEDVVGICSLPSLSNRVERQIAITKRLKHLMVIDGCHNSCSKKIADELGLKYDAYINLETSLGIKKLGPFTTLKYSEKELDTTTKVVIQKIEALRRSIVEG